MLTLDNAGKKPPQKKYTKTKYINGLEYYGRGNTPEEAQLKLDAKIAKLLNGENIKEHRKDRDKDPENFNEKTTFKTLAEYYIENKIKQKVRNPTAPNQKGTMLEPQFETYRQLFNKHVYPLIGDKPIGEIRSTQLYKVLAEMARKNYARSTIEKVHCKIKKVFSLAYQDRYILHDPSRDLDMPAIQKEKQERVAFTDKELDAILEVAKTHYYGPVVRFERYSGARNGEIMALRSKHIRKDISKIEDALKGKTKTIGPTKSDNGNRGIPILDPIYEEMQKIIEGKAPDDFVFVQKHGNNKGKPLDEGYMQRSWNRLRVEVLKELGAPCNENGRIIGLTYNKHGTPVKTEKPSEWEEEYFRLQFYNLRHTFRTECASAKIQPEVAQNVIGHGAEADKDYVHLNDREEVSDYFREAMNSYYNKKGIDKKEK